VFRIVSMTEAVGSTAAMMLIERGLLDFDTPVREVLPEFNGIRVLDGWDGWEGHGRACARPGSRLGRGIRRHTPPAWRTSSGNEADSPGRRRAGSQNWAGVLNTHCWFDPQADLAGVIITQSLPFVEAPFMAAYEAFERAACAG
jgi:CubicO group peptidase (beta-lactamase class C family)